MDDHAIANVNIYLRTWPFAVDTDDWPGEIIWSRSDLSDIPVVVNGLGKDQGGQIQIGEQRV